MLCYQKSDAVHALDRCSLFGHDGSWPYAHDHAAAIDAHWNEARVANPHYFNGIVYLVDALAVTDGGLDARLLRTDFKSYLYWRRQGFPECGVRDGFGSALIRAADGAILLGRQRAGNINGGLAYLPGGFIDGRDIAAGGVIDITASIVRELAEETGLMAGDATLQPGYLVTESGAHLSIAQAFQSSLDADVLKRKIENHLAADPASELDCIVIIRRPADLDGLAMPQYARLLVGYLLTHASSAL